MEALAELGNWGIDLNGPDPAPAGGLPQQGGPPRDRTRRTSTETYSRAPGGGVRGDGGPDFFGATKWP